MKRFENKVVAITGQAIVVDGGTEASLYLNYKRAK